MLKKIGYVLDKKQKMQLVFLLIIIFIGAFVELLGVSLILPIVNIVMDPVVIDTTWYLSMIRDIFHLQNAEQMLVFMAFLLIFVYIFKNLYITFMYNQQ